MSKAKIIIIDDNPDTCKFLDVVLRSNFEIQFFHTALAALDPIKKQRPDLILLDYVLPDFNGLQLMQRIRKEELGWQIPIIIMSATQTNALIIDCFNSGADDFIGKPFDYKELIARMNAKLKLFQNFKENPKTIQNKDLKLVLDSRDVYWNNKKIKLTQLEFDLLRFLIDKSPNFINREVILLECWKSHSSDHQNKKSKSLRTIDVHIQSLRKKIPGINLQLKSVYGKGYCFIKE